jgi:tyrosinase
VIIRKNQSSLTAAERKAFVDAVLELKRRGTYDAFVQIHYDHMNTNPDGSGVIAHWVPSFLPWHRQLLSEFERALQSVNPAVTIPYWDCTVDNSPTSCLWSADFLGGDGREADDVVTTGPFAGATGNWTIKVSPDDGPSLVRSFGRFANATLPTQADVATAMAHTVYDSAPWNEQEDTFRYSLERLVHSPPHVWIAGNMLGGGSPNDPVFWLHHCNIDRLWATWQRTNPDPGYLPAAPVPGIVDADGLMGPWKTQTPRKLLDISQLYTYV